MAFGIGFLPFKYIPPRLLCFSSSYFKTPPLPLSATNNILLSLCRTSLMASLTSSSSSDDDTKTPSKTKQHDGIPTDENVLAKHVAFFDKNHDGIVYPWETFRGFREIGAGLFLSIASGFVINIGLSQKTRPGKFPSLLFPIEIKNIQKAKHGSDSGVYDSEGRFVPEKFEEIFSKHAHTNPEALTGDELKEMIKSNREPKNYTGWFAGYIEWKILYDLCKDKNGLLHKNTIRAVYDGSLFEQMAKERAAANAKKK